PLDVHDRIDRACDRLEAAWGRGERPRIEGFLGEADGPYRAAWVRDLLAVELDARRRRGEAPQPTEYRARFPGAAAVIAAASAAAPGQPVAPGPVGAERDLLFGLLALQNGLIDQVQLVAAFQAWTRDKAKPLAEHLAARGDLDPDQRAGVEAMVGLHLKKHGG